MCSVELQAELSSKQTAAEQTSSRLEGTKEEICRLQGLNREPGIIVLKTDVSPFHVRNNERTLENNQLWNQEKPALLQVKDERDGEEPQKIKEDSLLKIKEEQDELLEVKLETDPLMVTFSSLKRDQSEAETNEDQLLTQDSPEADDPDQGGTPKDSKSNIEKKMKLKIAKLVTHTRTGVKPVSNLCKTCGKEFSSPRALNGHMRIHKGNMCFRCQTCRKEFSFQSLLTRHMRSHKSESSLRCQVCDRTFAHHSHLTSHMKAHTGEKRLFRCQNCDKRFMCQSHLNLHMRIHTSKKPFRCLTCDKGFMFQSHLTCHMRTHTGEKPFRCHVCDETFTHQCSFTVHMRTHVFGKPFKCQICDKAFIHKCSLTCHMKSHTEEKPFTCQECGKIFTIKGDLTRHLRVHIRKKPLRCQTVTGHMRPQTGENGPVARTVSTGWIIVPEPIAITNNVVILQPFSPL